MKRCIQGSSADVSELGKKCAKPNSRGVVKLWTEMMKGNISIENMLEISRQNGLGDADKVKEEPNFDGEYLTANGVQLAISETFKQLKDHQPSSNNIEIEQVGFQKTECDITKEYFLLFWIKQVKILCI